MGLERSPLRLLLQAPNIGPLSLPSFAAHLEIGRRIPSGFFASEQASAEFNRIVISP